jgi:hypothetical protein
MEAILLGAKTALPARKAYKSELNQILDAKPEQQEVKPLSDSAIRSTLAGISPRVAKCGNGEASTVLVKMVVSGQTGRIIDAKPTGKLARTSVGLCVSRAVRLAKFPRFDKERQRVEHRFHLE